MFLVIIIFYEKLVTIISKNCVLALNNRSNAQKFRHHSIENRDVVKLGNVCEPNGKQLQTDLKSYFSWNVSRPLNCCYLCFDIQQDNRNTKKKNIILREKENFIKNSNDECKMWKNSSSSQYIFTDAFEL